MRLKEALSASNSSVDTMLRRCLRDSFVWVSLFLSIDKEGQHRQSWTTQGLDQPTASQQVLICVKTVNKIAWHSQPLEQGLFIDIDKTPGLRLGS